MRENVRALAGVGRKVGERARRFNRNPRLVDYVRRARERTLGDGHFVERLSTSRGRASDLLAQQLAELNGDERGLTGELTLGLAQSWQRLAESQDRGRGDVDIAILFTDLVGFSDWALGAGDRAAVELLDDVTIAIEPTILEHRGEVVKRLGDGVMAVFWDCQSAVEAAFDMNKRVGSIEADGYKPLLRTGIHLGRPRKLRGDYLGVDVNIAARLAEAAKPGEILTSDRTLPGLDSTSIRARRRRFNAKGAPKDLGAYSLTGSRPQ